MPHPTRIELSRIRAMQPTFRAHPAFGIGCAALAALTAALATFTVLAYAV